MTNQTRTEPLDRLAELEQAATPGPWHEWHGDDTYAMNAYGVVSEDCRDDMVDDDGHPAHTVALTLLQQPRLASHEAHRWSEDAAFIAALRNAAPSLIAEARAAARLRTAAEALVDDWVGDDDAESEPFCWTCGVRRDLPHDAGCSFVALRAALVKP